MTARLLCSWLIFSLAVSFTSATVYSQEQSDTATATSTTEERDPFAGPQGAEKAADSDTADTKSPPQPDAESSAKQSETQDAAAEPADEAASTKATEAEKKAAPQGESSAAKPAEAAKAAKSAEESAEKTDESKTAEQEPTEIRLLALSGMYMDLVQPAGLDATSLLLSSGPAKQKSFYKLCEYVDSLAEEDDLQHIVLDLSDADLMMNAAQLDEFARHMKKLADAKKKTVAWLENASHIHLAIAAQCDQVIMADFGGVDMPSAAMQSMFYRDAMDLVGIKASVVRAGDFKGAVEPYVNPVMSSHLRAHYVELLKSMNDARVSLIADGRGLKVEQVRALQAKRMLLPADALAARLVDRLAPYGSMRSTIDASIEGPTKWTTRKPKAKKDVSFFELMGMMMQGPSSSSTRIRDDSLAVLHLSGPIVDGTRRSSGSIVSGPTVKMIEELGKENKIKGVVVRINSPGGSATASESIRQALV
ncbi:MAG: S49 family peptidase, partial [Planctomycetales bacterium]|nr:S49 family peptidase [Planctomycetales bacterium]